MCEKLENDDDERKCRVQQVRIGGYLAVKYEHNQKGFFGCVVVMHTSGEACFTYYTKWFVFRPFCLSSVLAFLSFLF